ncbi:MAG: choice-of-anchor D domain-containing protein, partial [Acetobacteraceae bacterium]|nr:choice-of-anchor D domain-containing protein [Acetobacteraceae bacterium]
MPWPFGPDTRGGDAGNLNRHGRRAKWRDRRQQAKRAAAGGAARVHGAERADMAPAKPSAVQAAPVLFESYEPRLLLSGAPIGTVLASSTGAADFVDADGTKVAATLTGPGQWQFIQGAALPTLTITGTDATSSFSITGVGGDGRVALEGVTVGGPLDSFSAATTDPVSAFSLGGAVQTIVLGNVRDMVLSSSAAIGSIAVDTWLSTGPVANGIDAPSLGSFTSTGQLNLDLNITGLGQALGSVLAGGALTGGVWQVAGDVGSIGARAINAGWTGDVTGEVGVVQTAGTFSGTLATASLGVIAIGGNFTGGRLLVGADLGADGRPGGADADADSFAAGYLGQLRVAGAMIGARVYVGVDPGNGTYDDGDDRIIGGAASRIQTLLVGGRIDSTSRIVTGVLPPSFFAGGKAFTPATAPRRLTTVTVDDTPPSLAAALSNDTGPSAADGITADPSVSGVASDAGGIAVLRGGLDGTAASGFVDLLGQLQADGSFTLSAGDMAALAGGTLSEGPHVLHLLAVDARGNARSLDLNFNYSNTQIAAALSNDTGSSASDGISMDYAVAGKVIADAGVVALMGALDGAPATAISLAGDGSFSLGKAQIDSLAGGALAEGAHVLHLSAQDKNGVTTTRDVAFTYDVTAPKLMSFGLSGSSDTGTLGDNITAAARVSLVGVSEGAAVATLGSATALAAANGGFQFADVALAAGDNVLKVTISDLAGNTASTAITINRSGTVTTDAALTWNGVALEAVRSSAMHPPLAARAMAMMGLAQFDTLAAIEGSAGFLVSFNVSGAVDTELALAKAAHTVLYALFPGARADLDAALAAATAAVPAGEARTNALAIGLKVGQAVLAIRAGDGSDNYVEFTGSTIPGQWRPTAPMYDVAQDAQFAEVEPFALSSPDQFLAPPPPDLTSVEYAAALNDVKALGGATGSTRTADQTEQAQFWGDGAGSYTPPGHWNQIAQQVAVAQGNSLAANVRLFAQLNVALADAAVACWNTKYTYTTWRPIDAIHNADIDGNDATDKDAAWSPLLITPPHPDYVSGHSTFSGAAAGVLTAAFGDVAFSTTSVTLPGVTRDFTSFTQAAAESGRSRIYGGIHTEPANQAGLTIGSEVAAAVLARFNLSQDTQGPAVIAAILPGAAKSNVTLTGQVLDNLSGVAAASYSIDGGAAQPLTLDSEGGYSITTAFALDGTADGLHAISISARDAAGNDGKTVLRQFRLDTRLPAVSLTSIAEGDTISAATRLTGTADPTGSTLSNLTYSFDGGKAATVSFESGKGGFDAAMNLGNLDIGAHTLNLTATDAAGNTATLTRTVTLAALVPFSVTSLTPFDGTTNVGSTQRPEVRFSRAVKPESLTSESFYATAADGTRLGATIVPAQDGSYAWLFLDAPMPGGAQITVHVDGARIRAAADGAFLDADGDGVAGGERTARFTTVSLTTVAGTILRGRVVDPGDDLLPMTYDDMRRGPDGVIHTADDVFLNPIAHAKVYILGQEDRFVFTDADGLFELTDLPAGNVKVAIDGRTATNAPTGVFWPEMVMDATLKPGEVNTIMDSMGSEAERLANAGRLEAYLPRVQTTIFSVVSDSAPTTVGVDANSAPNLTDSQRSALKLTVDPGSVIGADGKPLANAEVGIGTVPPELVRDMLPPGVLQHTFDITIQAPGVATFATPATISFPNVFGAAPGTKLNILSFDHTTGMLVINGTATVSEDGLSVVSDEGGGVRAPGWHGVTPPGGCNPAGGPPPAPPPDDPSEVVTDHPPVALSLMTGSAAASSFPGFTWTAPPKNPSVPDLPPIPGCEVPPHQNNDPQQPFINVTIAIDGPLATFAKKTAGGVELASQAFTLSPGTGVTKTFNFSAKTYAEMFGSVQGFADLLRDQLYGAQIKITVVEQKSNGTRTRDNYTYYQDRWVDVVHYDMAKSMTGSTMAFFRTNTDGVVRTNTVDLFLPNSVNTTFEGGAAPFTAAGSFSGTTTLTGKFDPSKAGVDQTSDFKVTVSDSKGPLSVGTITAIGTGTAPTTISVDTKGYRAELDRVLKNTFNVTDAGKDKTFGTADDTTKIFYDYGGGVKNLTLAGKDGKLGTADDVTITIADKASQLAAVGASFLTEFKAFLPGTAYTAKQYSDMLDKQTAAVMAAVADDYKGMAQYKVVADNAGADVTMSWQDTFFSGSLVYGFADFDRLTGYLKGAYALRDGAGKGSISQSALEYAVAEGLNFKAQNSGQFGVAINTSWTSGATFAQFVANTVSHELAHTFGLNDAYVNIKGKGSPPVDPPNDIMRSGNDADGDLTFAATNIALLKAALGIQPDGSTPITAGAKLYRDNFNLPGSVKGVREGFNLDTFPGIGVATGGADLFNGGIVAFGSVSADGAGGATGTVDLVITNNGIDPLTLDDISLASGAKGFTIVSAGVKGTSLAQLESTTLTLAFDPSAVGAAGDSLVIKSNAAGTPTYTVSLAGKGIAATAQAAVSAGNNNFGGMLVGAAAKALNNVFTITNTGATPLEISSIGLIEGAAEFTLLGVPADLATTPVSLALGQSMSFGIQFNPSQLGLQRAVIEVATNDPSQGVLRLGAVGTGVTKIPTASWGNDYVGIQVSDPFNPPPLNAVSDDKGFFTFFLPNDRDYQMTVFDPATGLVARDYGHTAASGKGVDLTASLVFGASMAPDRDFDGLPDDVEFAIGSNALSRDTDKDGLDDYTEIRQGLDVLGGLGLPVGVVSAAALKGSAESVTVSGSTSDPTKLTAYVATGNFGLAVVDVSKFGKPAVLAELDLGGTSTKVTVDDTRGIALLAAGSAGLHFVNVANPSAPVLMHTESYADPVAAVAVRDGSAFVASGTKLLVVDVATGDLRQTLELGGSTVVDVVVGVDGVYTLDSQHVVRTLSVIDDQLGLRGSVTLPAGGARMTVGNGVAYVAASTGGTGGFLTVDVSNLDAPALLSDVDDNSLAGTSMALNGSGLGLLAGGINFVFGGFKGLDLVDVSNPQNTGAFIQRFLLPDLARDVSIANGVAFVADGSGGLQVVNYRAFDTKGIAPSVSINVDAIDADPVAPGTQVLEGRSLHIVPTVTDDVQVRNVELLVNGKVVTNDPSFPFDLFAAVPTIKDGGTAMTVQLRATDTGGNVTLSDAVKLDVVPDTFPPAVNSVNLAEAAKRFFLRTIDVVFDEAINPTTINAGAISIVRPGADATFGTADDVVVPVKLDTRAVNHVLSVAPLSTLLPGDYRFTLGAGAVADAAGNATTSALVRNFTIRPASDVKAALGVAEVPTAPSANPGQQIGITVPFDPLTARMTISTIDSNGTTGTQTLTVSKADAALGRAYFNIPLNALTGDVVVFSQVGTDPPVNFDDGTFPLQIVPVVNSVDVTSVSGDGTTVNVTLTGLGFIEANNTEYMFGSTVVKDTAIGTGPNVYEGGPLYEANGTVNLTVPLSDGAFGPITVKTAGGTSA